MSGSSLRENTKPSVFKCVRSDSGSEFSGGAFRKLCDYCGTRREFATPDTLHLNSVANRGLAIVQDAAQAACFEAHRPFSNVQMLATASLRAETCFWVNDLLNRFNTGDNLGRASPWSRFCGTAWPLLMILPFLKAS